MIVLTEGTILWDEQRKDFDWDRTDAVPSELGGVFKDEPLYVDLCWARQEQKVTLEHPDFLNAVADLAAPIHACSKDELVGEDIRQHKKTKFMAWSAGTLLVLLTVSAVIAAYQATLERDEKERQRLVALSGRLAAESRFALEEKRFDLAALLGVEAKRTLSEESDPQIQSALFRAIYSYPQIRTHLHVESFTTSMAFSRDGKRLASAHFDGSIILWDLESKTHRWRVERPSSQRQGDYFGGATDSLSFSKDGKTLAITSGPGVAVWNVETGKLLKQLDAEKVVGDNRNAVTGKRAGMRQLAISQDHQKVAVVISSYPNLVLHVWSLESSASTKIKLEKPLNSPFMYFSSHGHLVIEPNEVFEPILNREADNQESNSKTVVLNPETGEPVKDAWGDRVWDPIMLANLHKERLRKFLSEKELPLDDPDLPLAIGLGPPRNSMEAIRRIRVDERQDTLDMKQSIVAAVTVEGDILLLDMDPAERTNVVKESQFTFGFGNGVALSRDASTIISGQTIFGTTLTFSDAQTGRVLGEIKQSDTEDSSLTGGVSADGKTVVFVTRDFTTVMVYRAPDVLNRFQLPEGALARSVAVSPTGNMLAVCFQFGRLMLWDIPSQKILSDRQISAEKSPIMALAYSGDGEHLAIGSDVTA
ncbi:MAG: WD40 repeat domain-containing protein, partial [Gammaproteobacteria bacterium]